jgi:ABC-2 type transport system permease protein
VSTVDLRRTRTLLAKDLRLGPRSPLVLWALFIPFALTLLVRGVFGGVFDAEPRLGIVDEGDSGLVAAAAMNGASIPNARNATSW